MGSYLITQPDILVPEIDLRAALIGDGLKTVEDNEWKYFVYENSWVDNSSTTNSAQYRKVGDIVELRGTVKDGTLGTAIFTLPVGYRPAKNTNLSTVANNAFGYAYINTDGEVDATSGSNVWFSLENLQFSIS